MKEREVFQSRINQLEGEGWAIQQRIETREQHIAQMQDFDTWENIEARTMTDVSPMPAALINQLSSQERRNLFKFLEEDPEVIPDSASSSLED